MLADYKDHIQALTRDLVKLAILSNRVVIGGNFPGFKADEVNQLLVMCNEIHKTYVKEIGSEKN